MTRVYVAPVSFGLGDLVVCLPVLQGLIRQSRTTGTETWLLARSDSQTALAERIAGLAGCVPWDDWDGGRPDDRVVDLRDHPLQRDHWWGSAEFEHAFGTLSINDIVARIADDYGIEIDLTAPVPLVARARPDMTSAVLLVTATDGPAKQWPAHRWRDLAAALRALGHDVHVVTRYASDEHGVAGVDAVSAPTPGDAVDVLSAARAVVGVDTGLTHIAVQQRTPTVMICRASCVYFRPWPDARAIRGAPCDDRCVALERDYAYNAHVDLRGFEWRPRACPVDSACLDPIDARDVLRALEELL
jgi:hypothetical protein